MFVYGCFNFELCPVLEDKTHTNYCMWCWVAWTVGLHHFIALLKPQINRVCLKTGYPEIVYVSRISQYKPSSYWGTLHLWKPPKWSTTGSGESWLCIPVGPTGTYSLKVGLDVEKWCVHLTAYWLASRRPVVHKTPDPSNILPTIHNQQFFFMIACNPKHR